MCTLLQENSRLFLLVYVPGQLTVILVSIPIGALGLSVTCDLALFVWSYLNVPT